MELIKSIKQELKKNKDKMLRIIKTTIVLFILIIFGFMFFISFEKMLDIFLKISIFLWLPFSLSYFVYTDNKEDRDAILKMWKVYFSIITLMLVFTISIESYVKKVKSDYFKTKLMYEIKTDADFSTIKDTFDKYERVTIKSIKYLEAQDVNLTKDLYQKKVAQKPYKIFYANLGVGIMTIVTLFMLLWAISELSWFKTPKKESKLKRIRLKYKGQDNITRYKVSKKFHYSNTKQVFPLFKNFRSKIQRD